MKKITLSVSPDKVLGRIKPMHCGNNYPSMANTYDGLFRALKIPFTRLHDTAFLNRRLVDIPSLFPDFDADENDPASYEFSHTDYFISRLMDGGCEPFFRLGVMIENYRFIKPYDIHPPKDFAKWARICEHVILHYNEGWANGFHFGIRYWEIWNEPENYPNPDENQMWTGTFAQYIELYKVTANHLKARFPDLKIGGYASCGFYDIVDSPEKQDPRVAERFAYYIDCFRDFLSAVGSEKDGAPLDFFSWHTYSNKVSDNIAFARYARRELDAAGYEGVESILNEWNPGIELRGTSQDAANILSNMLALQHEAVDLLMYYDFRANTSYNGVFDPVHLSTFPAYYAFVFFGDLYQNGSEVSCALSDDLGLFAVASKGERGGSVAVANQTADAVKLKIDGILPTEILAVDAKHPTPVKLPRGKSVTLAPASILLIRY